VKTFVAKWTIENKQMAEMMKPFSEDEPTSSLSSSKYSF